MPVALPPPRRPMRTVSLPADRPLKSPGIGHFSAADCAPPVPSQDLRSLSYSRLSPRLFTWPIRYPLENLCKNQKLRSPRISARFRTSPRSTEKPDQTTSGELCREAMANGNVGLAREPNEQD